MTWLYDQSTGDLSHDGVFVGTCYSGAGRTRLEGRNNPSMEAVAAKGPIPRGKWHIGQVYDAIGLGPICMKLEPVGHDPHGRTAFRIHGNNRADDASHGCIIAARGIREQIAASGDHDLEVVQ